MRALRHPRTATELASVQGRHLQVSAAKEAQEQTLLRHKAELDQRRLVGSGPPRAIADLLCDNHCPDPRCQLARMCKLRIGPIYLQHCARSCMPFLAVFRLQAMYRPDSHPKRAPLHGGAPSFHALSGALTLQSNIIAAKSPQPPQINNTATHSRPPTRSGHGRAE